MRKRVRLVNKVKRLWRQASLPAYLHHYGPKKFFSAELLLGLAVRELYRLSYRQAAVFLDEYYNLRLHWTTLQKAVARLPLWILQNLLRVTAPVFCYAAAIDGTGYTRRNPSEHYLKRIDGGRPQIPVKLSIMIDCDSRRVLSARARVRHAHDVKDVLGLVKQSAIRPFVVIMDKGYDCEPLHKRLDRLGIWSIAPTRARCRTGTHRKRLRDAFPVAEYGQRNIVEAVIKSIKQRFGGHVRGHSARTIRAELFIRMILHNLRLYINRLFLHTHQGGKIYKWMRASSCIQRSLGLPIR